MGICVEFNPDLALRNISHYDDGTRLFKECIPRDLEEGRVYEFLKSGQRNYWLEGEIALLETAGQGRLSDPLASIVMLEATHFVKDGEVWTRGKYRVERVGVEFNWMKVK